MHVTGQYGLCNMTNPDCQCDESNPQCEGNAIEDLIEERNMISITDTKVSARKEQETCQQQKVSRSQCQW